MSALLRRTLTSLAALGAAAGLAVAPATAAPTAAPIAARAAATTAPTTTATSATMAPAPAAGPAAALAVEAAVVPCSHISQIGDKKVVSDLGMQAFTVRQFIGWCSDSRGQAWMNFSSVYVWDQYHNRGFSYWVYSGVVVRGEPEARGFSTSANRQQTSYSTPVRTTQLCTQGWGKIFRAGSESAQGLTTLVC
ncbi:hypothetical protein ACWEOW_13285 [Monashia sp. NPDC004114]